MFKRLTAGAACLCAIALIGMSQCQAYPQSHNSEAASPLDASTGSQVQTLDLDRHADAVRAENQSLRSAADEVSVSESVRPIATQVSAQRPGAEQHMDPLLHEPRQVPIDHGRNHSHASMAFEGKSMHVAFDDGTLSLTGNLRRSL